jgi:hypothetical protein
MHGHLGIFDPLRSAAALALHTTVVEPFSTNSCSTGAGTRINLDCLQRRDVDTMHHWQEARAGHADEKLTNLWDSGPIADNS